MPCSIWPARGPICVGAVSAKTPQQKTELRRTDALLSPVRGLALQPKRRSLKCGEKVFRAGTVHRPVWGGVQT
jgi:hypothetical protein